MASRGFEFCSFIGRLMRGPHQKATEGAPRRKKSRQQAPTPPPHFLAGESPRSQVANYQRL